MRSLTKLPEPKVLEDNGSAWTAAFVAATPAERPKHARWGHPDIRATLEAETAKRCAYCEALIGHVTFPHVEHIEPKSVVPARSHDWSNLTTACPRCNVAKGDYHNSTEPLLNPYVDDPEDHLQFIASMVFPRQPGGAGERTLRRLKLDRLDLTNARRTRLEAVFQMVQRWRAESGALKTLLAEAIRIEASDGEYTAAVRALLMAVSFPIQ